MGEPIPGKGALLTQMALHWFDKLAHLCPNHLTGQPSESVVSPDEAALVQGRAMLVKRLRPLPVEIAVVRGYLAGSGYKGLPGQRRGVRCQAASGRPTPPNCPSPSTPLAAKAAAGRTR